MDIDIDIGIESGSSSPGWFITTDVDSIDKSTTDVCTVTITKLIAAGQTIRLYVSGGKEAGEDKGLGKNYTGQGTWVNAGYQLNYTTLTFNAEDATKTVTLTAINNTNLEKDPKLYISVRNTAGFTLWGNKVVTIVDDNNPLTLTATDQTQLTPLGLTAIEATADVDNATNFIAQVQYLQDNGGGVIYIPDGTYDFANGVIPFSATGKGVTVVGQSKTGTSLRKYFPAASNSTNYTFLHTLYGQQNFGEGSETPLTSTPVSFNNLTIDGNMVPPSERILVNTAPTDSEVLTFRVQYAPDMGDDANPYFVFKDTPTGDGAGTDVDPWQVQSSGTAAGTKTNLMAAMDAHGFTCYTVTSTSFNAVWDDSINVYIWGGTGTAADHFSFYNAEVGNCIQCGPNIAAGYETGSVETVIFDNIYIHNVSNSSAMNFTQNTRVKMYNVSDDPTENFMGQGTFLFSGFNVIAELARVETRFFHVELRHGNVGHNGTAVTYLNQFDLDDCVFDYFNFYPAESSPTYMSTDGQLAVNNMTVNKFISYSPGCTTGVSPTADYTFTDCTFNVGTSSAFSFPVNTTFTRCSFAADHNIAAGYTAAAWINPHASLANRVTVTYDDCDFSKTANATATIIAGVGLTNSANVDGGDGLSYIQIEILNSRFNSAFTHCFGAINGYGGYWKVGPANIFGTASVNPAYMVRWTNTATYNGRIDINGLNSEVYTTNFIYLVGSNLAGGKFNCSSLALAAAQNVFGYYAGNTWATWATNVTVDKYPAGSNDMRIITGTVVGDDPIDGTTPGLVGATSPAADVYKRTGQADKHCTSTADRTWT